MAKTPRCRIHRERDATHRVRWTHEGRAKVASLCDECTDKVRDLADSVEELPKPCAGGCGRPATHTFRNKPVCATCPDRWRPADFESAEARRAR
jgi:hypothetical protein